MSKATKAVAPSAPDVVSATETDSAIAEVLAVDSEGRLLPKIQTVEISVPETTKVRVEAPTQLRFSANVVSVLNFLIGKFDLVVNAIEPSVLEPTDTMPGKASYYCQAVNGYLSYSGSGSFFIKSARLGNPNIGQFNKEGKFVLRTEVNPTTGEVIPVGENLLAMMR